MKNPLAAITLVILSALAFSAGVWATFGTRFGNRADLFSRILFLIALPSPLIFVFRFFRNKYGFTMRKFLLCSLLPPYIVSMIVSVGLFLIGLAVQGMGGLLVLGAIVGWHLATLGLMTSAAVWISMDQVFEYIKHYNVRKALSIVLLTLCGAALGNGLYLILSPYPTVYIIFDSTPRIASYVAVSLVKAGIEAVPIGIGLVVLARFYREEYSVKLPIFMICIFLPTFLISGGTAAAAYFNDKKYYLYRGEFTDHLDNLLFAAAILVMTAILYAATSAVRRKKSY